MLLGGPRPALSDELRLIAATYPDVFALPAGNRSRKFPPFQFRRDVFSNVASMNSPTAPLHPAQIGKTVSLVITRIAQRFSAGVSIHLMIQSVKDGRIILSSLAGLNL